MHQFLTYIAVGLICALIDIGLMKLLISFNTNYIIATTAGFVVGLTVNFFLHTHITFKAGYAHSALFRYLIVVLANYCLTLLCVTALHQGLDMAILGKILSLPLVALNGFFLSKKWIYKHRER